MNLTINITQCQGFNVLVVKVRTKRRAASVPPSGNSCHFWFDDWLGQGKLIDITGPTGTIYLGIGRQAKVSKAVTSYGWSIHGRRSHRFQELCNNILGREPP